MNLSDTSLTERIWKRALLLTAIAVAIISGVSVWLTWHTSADTIARLSFFAIAPIFVAALISYSLRSVRFFYFLGRSGIAISLRDAIIVQTVGYSLSVTPGRLGEVFKLHMIRERTGASAVQTAPLVILDRLTEGGGFAVLAIVSAFMVPELKALVPSPWLVLLGLGVLFIFALTRDRWSRLAISPSQWIESRLGRLAPYWPRFWQGMRTGFTLTQIAGGLGLTVVARFADGFVVLMAAQIMGVGLSLPQAILVLTISGLAGGFSFLPVGVGATEATMTGLLVLLGAPLSNALAITLLTRLGTLWLWVGLGLVVAFWLRLSPFVPKQDSPP